MEQKETLNFMEEAKKGGISVKEIRPEEMHLLMSAYVTALFEVVVHDFPLRTQGIIFGPSMNSFIRPGEPYWDFKDREQKRMQHPFLSACFVNNVS